MISCMSKRFAVRARGSVHSGLTKFLIRNSLQRNILRGHNLQGNILQQRRSLFSLSRVSRKYDEYDGKLHPGMFEDQLPDLWSDDEGWCASTERIKQNQTYACWEYKDGQPLRPCTVTTQEMVDNGLHIRDLLALVLTPVEISDEIVDDSDDQKRKKGKKKKKDCQKDEKKVGSSSKTNDSKPIGAELDADEIIKEEDEMIEEEIMKTQAETASKHLKQFADVGQEVFRRPRPCILLRSGAVLMVFHHFKVLITDERLLFFDVYEHVLLSAMKRICRGLHRLSKIDPSPSEFRLRCVEEILQEVCSHESRKLVIMRASVDAVLQKIRNSSAAELEQGGLIVLGPLNDAVDFFDKTLDDAVAVLRTCIDDTSNDLSLMVHQNTSSTNNSQMTRNRMAATITLTTYAHHIDSLRSESQYDFLQTRLREH